MSELAARFGQGARQWPRVAIAENTERLALIALCITLVLTVVLSLSATPRRTGDAHQYLAMAGQLSQLRPPSLNAEEESAYRAWLESRPPESRFPDGAKAVRQPALIRDGRQEFSHFWLYPLLVAPATAIAGVVGAHPLAAFTVTNAVLLGVALWSTTRTFGPTAALLVIGSPLVWLIGRAQVEVFTVALLCLVMAAAARGRWGWAAIALAIASTQNAPIAAMILVVWAAAIVDWVVERRSLRLTLMPERHQVSRALTFAGSALAIALLHPAYYLIQLGVFTPQQLNGGIAGAIPSLGKYLAPLIDPDIGFVVWMPVTATLAMVGLAVLVVSARQHRVEDLRPALCLVCAAAMGAWFLFVFAQTTNVNSGGTVHVSRYALWLIPLTLPAIAIASRFIDARAPAVLLLSGVMLCAAYIGYFRPDQPERYVEHSPQAVWLMAHLPDAYRPIPEIFVERTLHVDGGPRGSAAVPSCRIVLVVAAQPEQPCVLSSSERADLEARFDDGDAAVWVRRGVNGASSVTTALAAP